MTVCGLIITPGTFACKRLESLGRCAEGVALNITTGIFVNFFAASVAGVVEVTITSTSSRTNSAQPDSRNPARNRHPVQWLEYVLRRAIEMIGAQVRAGARVDELAGNPDSLTGLAYAALEEASSCHYSSGTPALRRPSLRRSPALPEVGLC